MWIELSIDQIPLGPVPRNFLVANVRRKSPTSYGLVTMKSGVSPAHYEEVGDFQTIWICPDGLECRQLSRNLSLTCHEEAGDVTN